MNWYERHIGDYLKDTAHLSLLEHGVYTRLLDVYYTREGPIPDDQVARLIGARSRDEREALATVLQEYFELIDGCWTQARCDREIARYNDAGPEREARKANENTRMRRHRDERAKLFQALTDAGLHAPWNIKMPELRAMVQRLQQASPETAPATLRPPSPATAPATPATATQYPLPSTQIERERAGARNPVDNSSAGSPSHTAAVPAMDPEYRGLLAELRPDLVPSAEAVWAKFCGHKPPRQRTPTTWRQWVLDERQPGDRPRNGHHPPQPATSDPNSRASVEAIGIQLGVGRWNEAAEQWPAYRARVRHAQSQTPPPQERA